MRIKSEKFFAVDAEQLAIALLGKTLVRKIDGCELSFVIAETECYMGVADTACHASRKKPLAADALWERGGKLYVRLIYGLHFMLNIVAGKAGDPMGVLVRGAVGIKGPGNLAKACKIDKSFNKEDLLTSKRIWLVDTGITPQYTSAVRVGIDYAEVCDRERLWRFLAYDSLREILQ